MALTPEQQAELEAIELGIAECEDMIEILQEEGGPVVDGSRAAEFGTMAQVIAAWADFANPRRTNRALEQWRRRLADLRARRNALLVEAER